MIRRRMFLKLGLMGNGHAGVKPLRARLPYKSKFENPMGVVVQKCFLRIPKVLFLEKAP